MERIEQCIALLEKAMQELGQINFSGLSTIPAGRATEAIYIVSQELKQMKSECEDKNLDAKEETDG